MFKQKHVAGTMQLALLLAALGAPLSCGRVEPGDAAGSGGSGSTGDECDCQVPACADRITFVCSGLDHCPPTLDDALSYDRWPHEPGTLSETTYSICGDLSSFGVSHWEAPYSLTFGPDGLLIALANAGNSSKCGTPPVLDPSVDCRTCYVTRTGGLKHAGDDGEPARHESGYYFCQLDDDDQLVMPAGIPSDEEILCAPMDVRDDGEPCDGPPRYYWNGEFCLPFLCETCAGEDCARLSATAGECDLLHQACYAKTGIHQECRVNDDCTLAIRGCCGSCGTTTEERLFGIRREDEVAYLENCGDTPCPACASSIDQGLYAQCLGERCSVARAPER